MATTWANAWHKRPSVIYNDVNTQPKPKSIAPRILMAPICDFWEDADTGVDSGYIHPAIPTPFAAMLLDSGTMYDACDEENMGEEYIQYFFNGREL